MESQALVAICGIDGSGKSTQCGLLRAFLENSGFDVRIAKVAWPVTESVFQLAEHETGDRYRYQTLIPPTLREFVIACEVASYYRRIIEPTLLSGSLVVWDRGPLCYRAYARAYGADPAWSDRIYSMIPYPAITILLDLDPQVSYRRLLARTTKTIQDDESLFLLQRVRTAYRELIADFSGVQIIDAGHCQQEVHDEIRRLVTAQLQASSSRGRPTFS